MTRINFKKKNGIEHVPKKHNLDWMLTDLEKENKQIGCIYKDALYELPQCVGMVFDKIFHMEFNMENFGLVKYFSAMCAGTIDINHYRQYYTFHDRKPKDMVFTDMMYAIYIYDVFNNI